MKKKILLFFGALFFSGILMAQSVNLTAPANGSTAGLTPTLEWTTSGITGFIKYTVEITVDANPTETVDITNEATQTFNNWGSLTNAPVNNSTVTWRVIVEYDPGSGTTILSPSNFTFTATTGSNAATGLSPHDVKAIGLYPELSWTPPAGAGITLELEIATDSDFNNIVFDGIDVTGLTSYTLVSPLGYDNYYFWRIIADDGGVITNSSTAYFKTKIDLVPVLSWPSNNTIVYTLTPDFSWYVGVDFTNLKFQIMYDTDENFTASPVTIDVTGALTHTLTVDLVGGQKYYWRVKTINSDDNESDWSGAFNFTVDENFGAVSPILLWPIGEAIVYTRSPDLFWYSLSKSTTLQYEVQYQEAGTPFTLTTPAPITLTPVDTTAYQLSGLTSGTDYEWRVLASSNGTDWVASEIGKFSTYELMAGDPVKPETVYPKNNVTVYQSNPTFFWYIGVDTTGYVFDFELFEDDGSGTYPVSKLTKTGFNALNLQENILEADKGYRWRVTSYEDGGAPDPTKWSDWAYFGTSETMLTFTAEPVNFYPADRDTVFSGNQTLSWTYSGTLTSVDFQIQYAAAVDNDEDFVDEGWTDADPLNPAAIITTKSNYLIPTNLANGRYWWRVRARSGVGLAAEYSDWSTATWFDVTDNLQVSPLQPVASFPQESFTTNSKTIDFSWYVNGLNAGLSYYLEWAIDGFGYDFGNNKSGNATITNGDQNVIINLPETGSYKWRVRSFLDDGDNIYTSGAENESLPSIDVTFHIVAQAGAVQPIAGNPIGNVTVEVANPVLSWFTPNNAENLKYKLEVAADESMTQTTLVYDNLTDTKIQLSNLESGSYFWRVSSLSDGVYSQTSAKGQFTVANVTSVDEDSEIPTEFALSQNYPNPFNPSTTISFAVPVSGNVEIKVYNVIGQEVKTLVSEVKEPGNYKVTFDASNLSSGIYFYKATYGDKSIARKLVLLK